MLTEIGHFIGEVCYYQYISYFSTLPEEKEERGLKVSLMILETGATTRLPCSVIYAGPYPFSEPETIAMKSYLQYKIPDLKVYISLHSYGQFWLAPWGYTAAKPNNFLEQVNNHYWHKHLMMCFCPSMFKGLRYYFQKNMADRAIHVLRQIDETIYRFGTIADLMCKLFSL